MVSWRSWKSPRVSPGRGRGLAGRHGRRGAVSLVGGLG